MNSHHIPTNYKAIVVFPGHIDKDLGYFEFKKSGRCEAQGGDDTPLKPPLAGIEMLVYEPECIHLDCVKKVGMALMTYFEKKVNFDDPSIETNILRCFH